MRAHKNLLVWKESILLVKAIYKLIENMPKEERYTLIDQLKRAAISVPLNISEGAARKTPKEFLHFLFIANGSLSEIDCLLEIISELEIKKENELEEIMVQINRTASLLSGLIKNIRSKAENT